MSESQSPAQAEKVRTYECWHLDVPGPRQVEIEVEGEKRTDSYIVVGINARAAVTALGETKGDALIKVAIFDIEVEVSHPKLAGRVDAARSYETSAEGLWNGAPDQRVANPFDAHGTACAGVVGAARSLTPGTPAGQAGGDPRPEDEVVGVAPDCHIVPIRIDTNFDTAALINALRYAAEMADVILIPRYMPYSKELDSVIKDVAGRKPVVCAAGNDGVSTVMYPASLPETIGVGACNERGTGRPTASTARAWMWSLRATTCRTRIERSSGWTAKMSQSARRSGLANGLQRTFARFRPWPPTSMP